MIAVLALAGCAGGPDATQAHDMLQRAQAAHAQLSSVSYEAKSSVSDRSHLLVGGLITLEVEVDGHEMSFEVSYRLTSMNQPVRFPA